MFIFWGKKLVYRRLGYVADFCPVCRTKRSFELKRVGSASHVYYLTVGEGALVGFERQCESCSVSFKADPSVCAAVAKGREPVDALAEHTFPSYETVWRERLAIEARVQADPNSLSAEERHALIRSTFLFLSPKVERRFASTHIDKEVCLALVAAVALQFLGAPLTHRFFPDSEGTVLLVLLTTGIALVASQGLQSGRRFMRREVVPLLATALTPLKPSENEIRNAIEELKQLGHKMGKRLVLPDLRARLR